LNQKTNKTVTTDEPHRIDELDAEIIESLRVNGRRTMDALAKELGISVWNVKRRVQALISEGAINIYGAVKLGLPNSPILVVSGMNIDKQHIASVVKDIATDRSVGMILKTLGRYDLITSGHYSTLDMLSRDLEAGLSGTAGVKLRETFVCLSIYKGRHGRMDPYLLDKDDRDIMALLMKDGRQSNQDIAQKLNLSASSVSRRIKQLENTDTLRIKASISTKYHPFTAVIFARAASGKLMKAVNTLVKYPEVLMLAHITGRYELFGQVAVESQAHFAEFMERQMAAVEGIQDIEVNLITERIWLYDTLFDKYWAETHPIKNNQIRTGM